MKINKYLDSSFVEECVVISKRLENFFTCCIRKFFFSRPKYIIYNKL